MILQPLADRFRANTLEDYIGQKHLVSPDKPLYKMIHNHAIRSMIFFGPSGVGKTTLAHIIAKEAHLPFRKLNAVEIGKKDIQIVIEEAKMSRTSVLLYIDEIHRLTRVASEVLLPVLETGLLVLIGSTTESVFHSLPQGILSRSTVFELKPLKTDEIVEGLKRALEDKEKGLGEYPVLYDENTLEAISRTTGGDFRSALNTLEAIVITNVDKDSDQPATLTVEMVEQVTNKKNLGYDGKNSHYNYLSAFQKSIRGSDVDAALYYLGLLIASGDLVSICRRLSIIAFEDISLAEPSTWAATMAAVDCAEKVGFPEARIPLANAVTLLCLSPKTNSAYKALDAVQTYIQKGGVHAIPPHLQDAHYEGASKLGKGLEYKYPHDFNGWVKQQYLPDAIQNKQFFKPKDRGKEKMYGDLYRKIKDLQHP